MSLSVLAKIRCGCDPLELSGIIPGERCPHCQNLCDPWPHQTAMVRVHDARRDLAVAMKMVDTALGADDDGHRDRREYALASACLIANRATNALAFAQLSLHLNEEGRPATAMAGAHDHAH